MFRRHSLGNLYENSMMEIFHSEKVELLRESLRNLNNVPYCCEICVSLPLLQSEEFKSSYVSRYYRCLYIVRDVWRRWKRRLMWTPQWEKNARIYFK